MLEISLKPSLCDWPEVTEQWNCWRKDKSHIRAKLHREYIRKSDWLLTTHAASEAALRRILFIGLRQKHVPYKKVQDWMDNHHITFGIENGHGTYVTYFDELYSQNWENTLKTVDDLPELWTLWNNYAKPIRNHLAHAARKYKDDWLEAALAIDRLFMMKLDKAINPLIGGTPFADLRLLSPRLPGGDNNILPERVLNIRSRNTRPKTSLDDARAKLQIICEGVNG